MKKDIDERDLRSYSLGSSLGLKNSKTRKGKENETDKNRRKRNGADAYLYQ